ncbi:MAG: hypothetical protein K0Q57_1135, partial [Gammaproteobacteria bacterium]|nr:hypothetical protein [Gammaproteobacteria bacterium]
MSETKKILVTQQVQVVLAFFAMELVKTFYGSPRVEWTSDSAGKDAIVLLPFLECVLSTKNIMAYPIMAANYDKLPDAIKSRISKQNATLLAGMFGEVGAILAGGQILSTIPGTPPFIVASEAFAAVIFAVTVFLIAAINMRGPGEQPAQSRYARLTDTEAGNSLLELSRDTSMIHRISPSLAFAGGNAGIGRYTAVNVQPN